MKIKRRYPNYFSGFEETEHEVSSKEELLNIPWIKDYDNVTNHIGVFYSPTDDKYPDYLMTLCKGDDNKIYYFVVGYIYGSGKDLGLEDYKNFI
jgi:hypothetical protein